MTKAEFLAILEKHLDGSATPAERRLLDKFYRHHIAQAREEWTFTEKERIRMEIFDSLNRAIDDDVREHRRARFGGTLRIAASVAILVTAGIAFYLMRVEQPAVEYITATTQRGEQKTVTLSDGSVVRLNAESSITYPEQFADTRNVQLTGEAFFEVAHNEAQPFIIRSADLMTTVVGTSFNIRAYPEEESIAVTVATGTVKMETADHRQSSGSLLLTAGDQGHYDKLSASISRTQVDLEKYLAWKDGTILLEGVSLQEAANILARWYNVEFVFRNPEQMTCTIDGKFRNDKLENILENLRFLLGIEYQIEAGNRIIINGESCHQTQGL